jgi:hypothetical protein
MLQRRGGGLRRRQRPTVTGTVTANTGIIMAACESRLGCDDWIEVLRDHPEELSEARDPGRSKL